MALDIVTEKGYDLFRVSAENITFEVRRADGATPVGTVAMRVNGGPLHLLKGDEVRELIEALTKSYIQGEIRNRY